MSCRQACFVQGVAARTQLRMAYWQVWPRPGSPSRRRLVERLDDPVVRTVVDHFVRELQKSRASIVLMLDRVRLGSSALAACADARFVRQVGG
jgi:hypothetical protein